MLNKPCILTPSLECHTKSNVAAPRFHTTEINLTENARFENSAHSTNLVRNYNNLSPWFGVPC